MRAPAIHLSLCMVRPIKSTSSHLQCTMSLDLRRKRKSIVVREARKVHRQICNKPSLPFYSSQASFLFLKTLRNRNKKGNLPARRTYTFQRKQSLSKVRWWSAQMIAVFLRWNLFQIKTWFHSNQGRVAMPVDLIKQTSRKHTKMISKSKRTWVSRKTMKVIKE